MARPYTAPEAKMVHQSEEDGTPSKQEEQRKQPYERPTVTRRLVPRAEKESLLAEQNENKDEQSKGTVSGKG